VESRCRSLASFGCFSFTIPRRGVGHERIEQLACGLRHLLDGAIENFFVCFRRFRKAAELPNELQRRRADFFLRRRRFEVMKGFNISTHAVLLPTINQALRAVWEGGNGTAPTECLKLPDLSLQSEIADLRSQELPMRGWSQSLQYQPYRGLLKHRRQPSATNPLPSLVRECRALR
jgi:hypothetical protein